MSPPTSALPPDAPDQSAAAGLCPHCFGFGCDDCHWLGVVLTEAEAHFFSTGSGPTEATQS